LKLGEIEIVLKHFKVCPRCKSIEGFWLGSKLEYIYFQCKGCGAKFELQEVYDIGERDKMPERLLFFKK
jgi:translation initiation factor 2 beta subunit (eIF-2beta)/eIF-5